MNKPELIMNNTCPYPPEEQAICSTLVREIGRQTSWIDKVEAWQSLLSVRVHAKSMRDEQQNHFNRAVQSSQSGEKS